MTIYIYRLFVHKPVTFFLICAGEMETSFYQMLPHLLPVIVNGHDSLTIAQACGKSNGIYTTVMPIHLFIHICMMNCVHRLTAMHYCTSDLQ